MNTDKPIAESALTEKIIKAFYTVYNDLGHGFLEAVYENAIAVELKHWGLAVDRQVPFTVLYRGEIIGDYRADLIVENRVILEIKAASAISSAHEAQLLNYLKVSTLEVGLILNFGPKAEFKRKVHSQKNPRSSA